MTEEHPTIEPKAQTNGVIRVGRKGRKKFAFGEDGAPFEVDIVVAFYQWIAIDQDFRQDQEGQEERIIPLAMMPSYHAAALAFATALAGGDKKNGPDNTAEALDFIARLREAYDEVVGFFHPKSREERASPDSSGADLQFSEEES